MSMPTSAASRVVAVGMALAAVVGRAQAAETVVRDCKDCPEMVVLAPGSYVAGSLPGEIAREHVDEALAAREQPPLAVTIAKAFAIARTTVTRGAYARFALETGRAAPPCSVLRDGPSNTWGIDPKTSWRKPGFPQTDAHPVVCVAYQDTLDYAAWLSQKTGKHYRLPSNTEWEYAARAGVTTARLWGDGVAQACLYGNVSDAARADAHNRGERDPSKFFPCLDTYVQTAPVAHFKPNAFGLYDMEGNVWQWTADCLNATQLGAPADGRPNTAGDCSSHIDRGGSWTNSPKYLRLAAHHPDVNDARNTVLGFRLVRDID